LLPKNLIERIFNTYYKTLVVYANRFLPISECEDLVQDIFVEIWEKDLKFPDEISLKVYLYKSTRNKCFNRIKHQKVKDKYTEGRLPQLEDDDLFLEHVLEEEIIQQLYLAIEKLPDRKKEIIKLSLKGLKTKEISDMLGIKLQTAKTLKSQAYSLLRDQFKGLEILLYILLY
jgi:RNA polymerase sigma-70 factor (family 1)